MAKENFGIRYIDQPENPESGEQVKIIFTIDKAMRDKFRQQSERQYGLTMSSRLRQFIYQSINQL